MEAEAKEKKRQKKTENELIYVLYSQGLYDTEIARFLGVDSSTICRKRMKLGLPSNYGIKVDAEKLKELYKLGLNDAQIAARLGVPRFVIKYRRRKMGLKANRNRTIISTSPSPELSYIIGVAFGDGAITKNGLILGVKDRDFVKNFVNCAEKIIVEPKRHLAIKKRMTKWGVVFISAVYSVQLGKFLQNYGQCLKVIKEYPVEFIRGFADSERCIYMRRYKNRKAAIEGGISLANNNLNLLKFIAELMAEMGIKTSFTQHKCGTWYLRTSNKESFFRYCQIIGFSIKRKMRRAKEIMEKWNNGEDGNFKRIVMP
jgi:intein-encoded DNA endonuclease-like protein